MERVDSWKRLLALEDQFEHKRQEWVYRGQSSPAYRMRSTLERACADFRVSGRMMAVVERAATIDFKRSCHLYSPSWLPDEADTLGWMALMRHYGAPSRLLDFTYSLFIATYFAAEAERAKPVIWAVNKTWLSKHLESQILAIPADSKGIGGRELLDAWARREGWAVDRLLMQRKVLPPLVAAIGPMKMNDRLLLQQGVFLASTDVTVPFHDILDDLPGSRSNVVEIRITKAEARLEILGKLHRTGLSRAALFPGLQGFAESLRAKILTTRRLERLRRVGARIGPRAIGV
ncbi:MAG: FRG domain-containing protein [Bryobacteraceae bacterium]